MGETVGGLGAGLRLNWKVEAGNLPGGISRAGPTLPELRAAPGRDALRPLPRRRARGRLQRAPVWVSACKGLSCEPPLPPLPPAPPPKKKEKEKEKKKKQRTKRDALKTRHLRLCSIHLEPICQNPFNGRLGFHVNLGEIQSISASSGATAEGAGLGPEAAGGADLAQLPRGNRRDFIPSFRFCALSVSC